MRCDDHTPRGTLMRRTTTTVSAALFAVLLAAGCSGGGDDPKAATKPSAASSTATAEASESAESSSAPKLSVKWVPKLDAASSSNKADVCAQVGSAACTAHITRLTEVVYALDTAIDEAGAADVYPRTKEQIGKVEAASESYVDDGCADSAEATLGGSACGGYVGVLLLGPATASMTMTTDELTAGK